MMVLAMSTLPSWVNWLAIDNPRHFHPSFWLPFMAIDMALALMLSPRHLSPSHQYRIMHTHTYTHTNSQIHKWARGPMRIRALHMMCVIVRVDVQAYRIHDASLAKWHSQFINRLICKGQTMRLTGVEQIFVLSHCVRLCLVEWSKQHTNFSQQF